MSESLKIMHHSFFASCPKGLEAILLEELQALGIEVAKPTHGGCEFEAKPAKAFEVILYSRIASRVFMGLFQFDTKKEKDIYFEAKKFNWKGFMGVNQTFKVTTILGHSPNGKKRSQFTNSMFLGLQLKDGLADKYRAEMGKRPDVNPEDADFSLLLHVQPYDNPYSTKELCTVSVDLCGEPLSNRGYRTENFLAPMRENLAAGILKLTGLNSKETFIDGMCGSGTLIIEAALIMAKIPPSFLRVQKYLQDANNYPWKFLQHTFYTRDKTLQDSLNKSVANVIKETQAGLEFLKTSKQLLCAVDIDTRAIEITKKHMLKAGLTNGIEVTRADVTKMQKPKEGKGIIIMNPPYGERLEPNDIEKLEQLYYDLGENLKHNFRDYKAFVFAGNLEMLKKISLRTSKKHILHNGNIECRLAEYNLY